MKQKISLKQPKELYILFFTEMWERFNYYGMRALLVLYMVYDLFVNGTERFGDIQAYTIYAAFGALVYATPYIGGTIADKILGYKKSIIFGGIIMAIGEFMMMIPNQIVFFFALSFIIVGNGFFKPNISSMVGGIYDKFVISEEMLEKLTAKNISDSITNKLQVIKGKIYVSQKSLIAALEAIFDNNTLEAIPIEGSPNVKSLILEHANVQDPRRDGAFTIFYMGINLGAAIAPILTALIMDIFGFRYAFGAAGFGMIIGIITFSLGKAKLGDNGNPPDLAKLKKKLMGIPQEYIIYIASILTIPFFMLLVYYHYKFEIIDYIFPLFGAFVLFSLVFNAMKSTKVERERLFVVIILILFSVMFWAFFEQAGSSLTLYTEMNIDRWIGNWQMPTPLFQSVNPLFIILLGPVFASLWMKLNSINREPSTPLKFAMGLLQLGIGFGFLVLGAKFAVNGYVPILFIILVYLFNTTGELCLSPVGLSMVTKLSPKKIVGMVMGAWMLSVAFALYMGGTIAKYTSTDKYMERCIVYEPKLNNTESDVLVFNVFEDKKEKSEKILKSGKVTINVEIVENVKDADAKSKPDAFYVRRSIKPDSQLKFNMRVSYLDPVGDLTDIKLTKNASHGNVKIDGDNLEYIPKQGFEGVDTIEYMVTEKELPDQSDKVALVITIDNKDNHPPIALTNNITVKAWKKPWYTKSALKINALDYFYDADGDPLNIEILENPDSNKGTAKIQNNLNSYVGPNKTIHIYTTVFKMLAIVAISIGVVLLMLVPLLKKWMHGMN